jgi:hypothetical protein
MEYKTIRISEETWKRLQAWATPFSGSERGTPEKVIAHLLDEVEKEKEEEEQLGPIQAHHRIRSA